LLLYPEYNEYEMVQEWSEGVTFSEMLEQMYPAPWDKKKIYTQWKQYLWCTGQI